MTKTQMEQFEQIIVDAKDFSRKGIAQIYDEIAKDVMNLPSDRLAQAILKQESPKVNEFILLIQKKLKEAICATIHCCGLSDAVATIIWANVMRHAGMPEVSLCRTQDVNSAKPASQKKAGPTREQKEEINRLAAQRSIGVGIAAAGLAAEIITCLIVPGWTGVSGIIKVTKVAGLMIIGTGIGTAASAHVRLEEINRLVEQYQKEEAKEELHEVIRQVCKHQAETNTQIICTWLDRIFDEVIRLCDLEMKK